MIKSTTIHTAHGYAIRVRRVGVEIELETSSATGDVVSTVRMSEDDAVALMDELDDELEVEAPVDNQSYRDGYDEGYRHGHSDGQEDAA